MKFKYPRDAKALLNHVHLTMPKMKKWFKSPCCFCNHFPLFAKLLLRTIEKLCWCIWHYARMIALLRAMENAKDETKMRKCFNAFHTTTCAARILWREIIFILSLRNGTTIRGSTQHFIYASIKLISNHISWAMTYEHVSRCSYAQHMPIDRMWSLVPSSEQEENAVIDLRNCGDGPTIFKAVPWQKELSTLIWMGFTDNRVCACVLIVRNYDVATESHERCTTPLTTAQGQDIKPYNENRIYKWRVETPKRKENLPAVGTFFAFLCSSSRWRRWTSVVVRSMLWIQD